MTVTLTPDTKTRLRTVATGRGQAPEQALETLLAQALADAADFAAGRWTTPEALDAMLQTRRP